ncbi:metal-sensing transcriptional repressor [Fredinandcohnia sp. 179-A 10B2 NHS]|uniref:metal-sensing transcriptional repressor n=1 Tax=Fredinandcohnia sp. 179-A 10B2 NHS TaxID=3235176 RepID=UPI0039A27BFF
MSHSSFEPVKQDIINDLRRVANQVSEIKECIQKDFYVDEVIPKISSAQAELYNLKKRLLEEHVKSCILLCLKENDNAVIDELMITVARVMK